MARAGRKKGRVSVKEMKFRNDPMIRFYEKSQDWLQERGRPLVIAVIMVVAAVVVYAGGSYFFDYRKSKAEAAFGEAVEKFNAKVIDPIAAASSAETPITGKTYPTEQIKWEECAETFERLASDYPGYYGVIGRYYSGVSYLQFDRPKGLAMLQEVAEKNDQPTSDLARLALAESHFAAGDTDKAIELYKQLLSSPSNMKVAVQYALGRAYEKAGDKDHAVEAYLEVARLERTTPAGSEAEKRLSALAPDRLKELPPPTVNPVP